MSRLTDAARRQTFGPPCTAKNLVTVTTPWGIRTRAHRLVADRFLYACELAAGVSGWVPARIDSYACRTIRGATSTSLHSFGLAWDLFDRPLPQPVDVWGPTNAPDAEFRAAFAAAGFTLGAEFKTRRDVPHIEWAAGLPPAIPTRPVVAHPAATVDVPLVKPITTSRTGEATGMKISTHLTQIPALDNEGRGWVDVPYPWERIVSLTGHGSSPPDDGAYWPSVILDAQPRGAITRITLEGGPGKPAAFWFKLLEEE